MTKEIEPMIYIMAAEKVSILMSHLEHTINFVEEYGVKPDKSVVDALQPILHQYAEWLKKV